MNLILTNFGHRFITEQSKIHPEPDIQTRSNLCIIAQVLKEKFISVSYGETYEQLVNSGYFEIVDNVDFDANDFRYKTNPLENVSRIVFEFTTRCNFNCSHCLNGYIQKTTETNIAKLKSIADTFGLLNNNRFDFIGGEVTKYGDGWLELAAHINCKHDTTVTIITNGWWLENARFEASGRHYLNDAGYLTDLEQHEFNDILFSNNELPNIFNENQTL